MDQQLHLSTLLPTRPGRDKNIRRRSASPLLSPTNQESSVFLLIDDALLEVATAGVITHDNLALRFSYEIRLKRDVMLLFWLISPLLPHVSLPVFFPCMQSCSIACSFIHAPKRHRHAPSPTLPHCLSPIYLWVVLVCPTIMPLRINNVDIGPSFLVSGFRAAPGG